MEVILLQKVESLGVLGDKVRVKPGFARNYLIPQGKAKLATKENLIAFEARRAELEKLEQEALQSAQSRADALKDIVVVIKAKAGSEGKLYGSIGARDVAEALTSAGFPTEKHEVRMPQGALRAQGEYEVLLRLHSEIEAKVFVQIEADTNH